MDYVQKAKVISLEQGCKLTSSLFSIELEPTLRYKAKVISYPIPLFNDSWVSQAYANHVHETLQDLPHLDAALTMTEADRLFLQRSVLPDLGLGGHPIVILGILLCLVLILGGCYMWYRRPCATRHPRQTKRPPRASHHAVALRYPDPESDAEQ